ncbi:prominin-2 [Tamandua tetradactyla]|uniref:prominin-2 n=1 Tax=Tamandua tetradactyla TaxID=48850 RepID=UPI004053897C
MPRARGLLTPLLGLALALSLPAPGAGACGSLDPPERLPFTPASRARWLAPRLRAPGPLDPLYGAARRFLSVVQLNPFPAELVKALLNEPSSVKVDEVVRYEAGYVACAAVAVLYLLALPAAGLGFCCCRRRQRCGGRVKMEHKALACERAALGVFLLLTTLVLLTGAACALAANQRVHTETGPSVQAVPETLLALQGLVSDVPQELQALAQQFSLPQGRVSEELDGVGARLGSALHSQLRGAVYPALASVRNVGHALQVSVDHLRALSATSVELRERQGSLGPAVWARRERLLALLQEAGCEGCTGALGRARALELGADFHQLPSVEDVLHRLDRVPEANFSSMVQEENSTFNTLPLLATVQTAGTVRELKDALSQSAAEVRALAAGFPGWEAAARWSRALGDAELRSRPYLRQVQRYETFRWVAGCVLCSTVLLVVACNLLGLGLGAWGLSAREDSSHSEARGEAGARCLMVGVGLSFLFAAPLILLVFATFLVGGNVQTLVCRSWESGELLEFVDTPGNLPLSVNLSHLLGLKRNVSLVSAYQQCREGAALWRVLQLNHSYDLETHLDVSRYTARLQRELRGLRVDVQDVRLLSPGARRDLETLQHSGLHHVPFARFRAQAQKPVVTTDVARLAQELEALARAQDSTVLGRQLQEEARALRSLSQERVRPQQSLVAKLNLSVQALASSAPSLQVETSDLLAKVTSLEGELPARAIDILRNESECFLAREVGYFSQYADWVREEVTQHVATCQPLSGALDNGRVILCDMMTDPWNAFWLCLAGCTFFLIPSIIFAVKTSKYFRPVRKRLSSTSSEETQLFHIPRVTSLKL